MDHEKEQVIKECRHEISEIDREILTLVKKREQLSLKIGHAKRDLHIPDRDFDREKIVFKQAIEVADELGLKTSFATALQTLIIQYSLSRQEKDRIKNSFAQKKRSVLIIGGAGRLGQWLCRFFSDSGHDISVVDLKHPNFSCPYRDHLEQSDDQHDIIVVATPIRVSVDMLKRILELKLNNPIIFDVSSVKTPVQGVLEELKENGFKVTSLHPMFGPTVELLFGKQVIRTSLNVKEADSLVDELFCATSLQVVDMSMDEHDSVIAVLLSLSHVINLIFVGALQKSRFPIDYLEKLSSPTFLGLLSIARNVFKENPHLYYEIQALNPHTSDMQQHLLSSLEDMMRATADLDEEGFVDMMKRGESYL